MRVQIWRTREPQSSASYSVTKNAHQKCTELFVVWADARSCGKNRHTFCRSRTVFKYCVKMCVWSHGLNTVHCSCSMTHRTLTLNIRNGTSWINIGNSIKVPVHKFPSSLTVCLVDFLCSCEMITEASRWFGILSYKKWSAWRRVGMCTT